MKTILLFLGCWAALIVVAAIAFHRIKSRRPYLAARFDDGAGNWADETPTATSPADLDALELLWDLPAYSGDDHTTTNPTGD
ncbi:hypothetical protein [Streptomyces bottropensis]|uniref:hypothetical protein n=1 Tax=Streptomyces bottropensis TaxID=42235 RepID=UPI0036B70AD9